MRRTHLCALAFLALIAPARSILPQTSGSLSILGGSSTDARGIRANALTIAPSMTSSSPRALMSLGATGTFFDNSVWTGGLTASASLRSRQSYQDGFGVVLAGDGSATTTSFNTSFLVGEAIPTTEFTTHGLTLFGGARGVAATTAVSDQQNGLPRFGIGTFTSVTRSSIAPTYGAQFRVPTSDPRTALILWARSDPMRISGAHIDDASAGATFVAGRLVVAGSAGRRRSQVESLDYASITSSLSLSAAASLVVSAGSYPSYPLTGAAGGHYVTVGLTSHLGGAHAMPAPSGVPRAATGFTRLSIRAQDASRVEIAGDWNAWDPVPVTRASNGVWYVDVELSPGEYRYAFRIDGKEWRVPEGTVAVDDGFGGKSAYVRVRDAGPTR